MKTHEHLPTPQSLLVIELMGGVQIGERNDLCTKQTKSNEKENEEKLQIWNQPKRNTTYFPCCEARSYHGVYLMMRGKIEEISHPEHKQRGSEKL